MLGELKEVSHQVVGNKAKRQLCFKNPKHVKFSKKRTFLTHWYAHGGQKCSFLGKFDVLSFLETPILRFALLPSYRQNNIEKKLVQHATENYGLLQWRQCHLIINFLIQPSFQKTRTQFLSCNIVRIEEGFEVLFFIIFRKQKNYS